MATFDKNFYPHFQAKSPTCKNVDDGLKTSTKHFFLSWCLCTIQLSEDLEATGSSEKLIFAKEIIMSLATATTEKV